MTEDDLRVLQQNQDRAAVLDWTKRYGGKPMFEPPVLSLDVPLLPKPKPNAPYRSKTEARYAQHLDLMVKSGYVLAWRYEAITLVLAPGVRYSPDFLVYNGGDVAFYEVKGRKGKTFWAMPVGKVKVKLAASLFPWWKFHVVWPSERSGEWESLAL